MLHFFRRLVPLVASALLFGYGWHLGSSYKDSEWKGAIHDEYVKQTEARQATQRAIDEVSAKYQEDIAALEGSTDRVITDLHRDNKRLRIKVKTLNDSSARLCGRESDGRAELDERDAKRILAVTQKGDAWIKALQATIRTLQQREKEKTNGN